jgi:hypothetical protein
LFCDVQGIPPTSVQKTGIYKARHDCHQGIKSGMLLRDSPPASSQERWQTDLYDMREPVFSLSPGSRNTKRSSNDESVCRQSFSATIAKPRKLRRASGNEARIRSAASRRRGGQEQTERPDRSAMRVAAPSLSKHVALAIPPRCAELLSKLVVWISPLRDAGDPFECRQKGTRGSIHHFKAHIRMGSRATAIDQSGLRRQIRFLNQGIHCKAGEKISRWFVVAFFRT